MISNYTLQLVPEDGETLLAQTKREWLAGYMFRVLDTSCLVFKRGERITIRQIEELVDHSHLTFDLKFKTITVKEQFQRNAEDCYASEQVAKQVWGV